MITDKDYYRITNCTSDFGLPAFTIEEVQQFLARQGYEVIIHKGLAKVEYVEMGMNEVINTGKYADMEREIILAVKPADEIPERVDKAVHLNFRSIFMKEIKKKLLAL